jgi:hypothetical protein
LLTPLKSPQGDEVEKRPATEESGWRWSLFEPFLEGFSTSAGNGPTGNDASDGFPIVLDGLNIVVSLQLLSLLFEVIIRSTSGFFRFLGLILILSFWGVALLSVIISTSGDLVTTLMLPSSNSSTMASLTW